jgi:hypothetical protein
MFKKISLIGAIVVLSACQSDPCGQDKQKFVEKYTHFLENATNSKNPDWDSWDKQLRQYVKECYPQHREQLNFKQRKDFWIGVTRYFYARYGPELLLLAQKGQDELLSILIEELKTFKFSLSDLISLW